MHATTISVLLCVCVCLLTCACSSLSTDPLNAGSLREIESAMFALCLDKPHPQVPSPPSPIRDSHAEILGKRALHGNGTHQNSCNRWFDLAVQASGGGGLLISTVYTTWFLRVCE